MTNNTITPVWSIKAQNNNSYFVGNNQRSFSDSQKSSMPFSGVHSPETLHNQAQLVQTLLKQLGSDSEKDTASQHLDAYSPPPPQDDSSLSLSLDQDNKPILQGTSGNDKLNGSRAGDEIRGLAGDDRIYGRQGNDLLLGNEGNDRLYGGKGDDELKGGDGNDYLLGGRGNNTLFGGKGNDVLYSRLGSDKLDGGEGNDTARIKANIDNFTINVSFFGVSDDTPADGSIPSSFKEGSVVTLTHKETGKTIRTIDIENFRFNDARLTLAEITEHSNPPSQLDLDNNQKLNLFDLFLSKPSNSSLAILDSDGNKAASIGDIAVLSGGINDGEITRKTLTAMDVSKINKVDDLELRLNLADQLTSTAGTATAEDIPPVINELIKLPTEILQSMADEGSKVIVVRDSVVEYYPELAGVTPRGWPPELTWDSVPGGANTPSNELVIATRLIDGERRVPPKGEGHGSYNLVLHEAAHIYDALVKGSSEAGFIDARNQEIESGRLTTPYLLQEGDAGLHETFATAVAVLYGGSGLIENEFPLLFNHLRETVGERHTTVPTVSILGEELDLSGDKQKEILESSFVPQNTDSEFIRVFDTSEDGIINTGDTAVHFALNEGNGSIFQQGREVLT